MGRSDIGLLFFLFLENYFKVSYFIFVEFRCLIFKFWDSEIELGIAVRWGGV